MCAAGTTMPIQVIEEAPTDELLRAYAEVPISFMVRSRFRVEAVDRGLGGWTLTEEPVEPPYEKDYDRDEDNDPVCWLRRWDISHWAVISARDGPYRIGGAGAGYNTPGAHMEEARDDLRCCGTFASGPSAGAMASAHDCSGVQRSGRDNKGASVSRSRPRTSTSRPAGSMPPRAASSGRSIRRRTLSCHTRCSYSGTWTWETDHRGRRAKVKLPEVSRDRAPKRL